MADISDTVGLEPDDLEGGLRLAAEIMDDGNWSPDVAQTLFMSMGPNTQNEWEERLDALIEERGGVGPKGREGEAPSQQ